MKAKTGWLAMPWNDDADDVWGSWVRSTSNCVSTSCTSNADTVWRIWVDESTTSGTSNSTIYVDTAWSTWASQTAAIRAAAIQNAKRARALQQPVRVETPEERMAREAAHVKAMAEQRERQRVEEEKRASAKKRAKKLLMDHITKDQRESLEKHGFFDVKVGEKTYRIRQGTHGNVRLLDKGKEITSYCIQPNGIPDEDAMLAQKLLLETDEASFLRIANATRLAN